MICYHLVFLLHDAGIFLPLGVEGGNKVWNGTVVKSTFIWHFIPAVNAINLHLNAFYFLQRVEKHRSLLDEVISDISFRVRDFLVLRGN